jgi:hypothetical protein
MRKSIFLLLLASFLASCAVSNRIIEIDDPYKEIKSIKLIQNPMAFSSEKIGRVSSRKYSITSIYLFEEKQNGRPEITVDIRIITPLRTDELDSVMFFNLDNEKIRIVSEDQKLMSRQFIVPENLWVPFVFSQDIQLRLYLGKQGIDVKLSLQEILKLKQFFKRAIQRRDFLFPAIPEGKKKW